MNNKEDQVKQEESGNQLHYFHEDLKNKLSVSEEKSPSDPKLENSSPFPAVEKISMFQNNSWLYKCCLLNAIPLIDAYAWANDFIRSIHEQKVRSSRLIPRLQFFDFHENEQYLCHLLPIANDFAMMKVRNWSGQIVLYRLVENSQVLKQVYRLYRKLSPSSFLFVLDETDVWSHFSSLTQQNLSGNLVYLHKQTIMISDEDIQIKSNCCYRKVKQFMVYYYKKIIKKIDSFEIVIDNFVEFETEDRNCLNGLVGSEQQLDYDWRYLAVNIIRQCPQADPFTIQKLLFVLNEGQTYLKSMIQQYSSQSNRHLPRRGEQKNHCSKCNKKINAICDGCSTIAGKGVYLCIGDCFSSHHLSCEKLTMNPRQWVCTQIEYFDFKYSKMFKKLSQLITNESDSQEICDYTTQVNVRLMKCFSLIAEKRLKDTLQPK